MADQGVHSAECGFVDDVNPGKYRVPNELFSQKLIIQCSKR